MPDLGFAVIGGRKFPLTDVRLTGGALRFSFKMMGPQPELRGHLTLFGEDGQGIYQGHELVIPEIKHHHGWVFSYDLTVGQILNWDEVSDFRLPSERPGE